MMEEQKHDLEIINNRLTETIKFLKKIIGDRLAPVPIIDEKTMASVQANVGTLMELKNCVLEYFKPRKIEAKKPYEELLESENAWLTSIKNIREFTDGQIKIFNDDRRRQIQAAEQAEADERAQIERERMAEAARQAEAAGNAELAEEIKQEEKEIIAAPVIEKKMMQRSETGTMSEKEVIADFMIVNHSEFSAALMEGGMGSMIVLDKKTETSFERYLKANRSINKFPGVTYRRDFEVIHKRK